VQKQLQPVENFSACGNCGQRIQEINKFCTAYIFIWKKQLSRFSTNFLTLLLLLLLFITIKKQQQREEKEKTQRSQFQKWDVPVRMKH